ncbi:MAG: Smr/MutS family protein [Synergistaceae bacterium]|jgi:DNA mismatch repair protein MutS2|nr:Smr/MutS family protein [Synergistaceae bacterium]
MDISESVLDLLEFEKSLFPFAENLRGELGQNALASLAPCKTMERLEGRHELLRAWSDCSDRYGDKEIPWNAAAVCVTDLFPSAKKSGFLFGEELLKVKTLLSLAARVKEALSGLKSSYPVFESLERRIRDFTPELEALSAIEESGRLADGASAKLQEIRNDLENLKRAGRKTAGRLMEDSNILNMLQERSLAYRDGRFLLVVRQEYVNRFPGLLVDRSASGNSVYMEPRMLSTVNNSMILKVRDEQDEETRILMEITRKILARERAVSEAQQVLGEVDLLHASREVMRKRRWTLPALSRQVQFNLVEARHPLLKDAAVPVTVHCGAKNKNNEGISKTPSKTESRPFTSLVITGPNTGGKTVILKTVGLCVTMGWSGLPLPARDGSSIGNIDAVYADIGDEQSIEQNLSTFSAHLKNIVGILKTATSRSLVLLDELGAGTDPQEGAALGMAILETLKNNRTLTLASTHHNPIKQYALTTPSVETASLEFDADNLAPTYRLLMGVPGKSNALLIAKRWGLPESVLDLAYASLRARDISVEDLIGQLNERKAALDAMECRLEKERAEMAQLKKIYESRVAEIEYQKDKILSAADKRASDLIAKAEATSRDLIRGLEDVAKSAAHKEFNAKRQEFQKIRKGLEARHDKRVARELENKPETFEPKAGATVQVAGSDIVGVIESVKNGKARLTAGPMHVEVSVDRLVQTRKTAKVAIPPADTASAMKRETVPGSLMVRGMSVDEALPLMSTYLDRAYRAGHSSVLIIHGRGEGILRREVHALCARLKYVSDYHLGDIGEGGYGVTVVEFGK